MYKTADMTQMSASHYLTFHSYLNMLQARACIDNDWLSCTAIFGVVTPPVKSNISQLSSQSVQCYSDTIKKQTFPSQQPPWNIPSPKKERQNQSCQLASHF